MGAEKQTERELLLAQVAGQACRVKVIDEKGAEKYRDISSGIEAILPTDELVVVGGNLVTMRGTPGRRPKPPPPKMPAPATTLVAELVAAKQHLVDTDQLLAQLDVDLDDEAILYHVMRGFAEEAASIRFERLEAERQGTETSALSGRRINALRTLGDTFLKRKELLANKVIDLNSPAFIRLFKFMLDSFREAMINGGVPRDQTESVFTQLSKRMADETWESEARTRMKGA
jgi:hypothetical protein